MILRNMVTALVVFAILIGLNVAMYTGVQTGYGIVKGDTRNGADIMDSFNNLNIIEGLNLTTTSIYKITAPTSTSLDILGAFAGAAVGLLRAISGLLTFPFEIFAIILQFYPIPTILVSGVVLLIVLYVGFMLLSAYLRDKV